MELYIYDRDMILHGVIDEINLDAAVLVGGRIQVACAIHKQACFPSGKKQPDNEARGHRGGRNQVCSH